MRAYAQSGQYHIIVQNRFLICYHSHALITLVISIESSSVEQMVYFVQGLQRRSRASIERRMFEGSIGLRGGLLGGSSMLNAFWEAQSKSSKSMRAYAQNEQYQWRVVIFNMVSESCQ